MLFKKYQILIALCFSVSTPSAYGVLFDSQTMRGYCQQYLKLVALEDNVDHYEAGLCSGYISSKIELMSYSQQLCRREQLNVDQIISYYVSASEQTDKQAAMVVLMRVLEQHHGCQ